MKEKHILKLWLMHIDYRAEHELINKGKLHSGNTVVIQIQFKNDILK